MLGFLYTDLLNDMMIGRLELMYHVFYVMI